MQVTNVVVNHHTPEQVAELLALALKMCNEAGILDHERPTVLPAVLELLGQKSVAVIPPMAAGIAAPLYPITGGRL